MRFAIVRVQPLQNAGEFQPFRWRITEQDTPLVVRPYFVATEIPHPDAQVRSLGGQGHPLLIFAQVAGQMRRAEHVAAQFIPHHHQHAEEWNAHDEGHPQPARRHQPGLRRRKDDEKGERPAHEQRPFSRFRRAFAP